MKKCFLLLLLALSCNKAPLFPGWAANSRMPDGRGRSQDFSLPDTVETIEGPSVYLTAVCGGELVMWRNGKEALRYEAKSPTPERHRVRGGHLWEDACEGGKSMLYRDGEPVLRFDGEASLRGLLEEGGILYTLWQRPGGNGWRLMAGDKFLAGSPTGVLVGDFDNEGRVGGALDAGVTFAAGTTVREGDEAAREYVVYKGGTVLERFPPGDGEILDLRVLDGTVVRCVARTDGIYLFRGNAAFLVAKSPVGRAHVGRIRVCDGQMEVLGYSKSASAVPYHYWIGGTQKEDAYSIHSAFPMAGPYSEDDGFTWISYGNDGALKEFFRGGSYLRPPGGEYRLSNPSCAMMKDGMLLLALTSARDGGHLLLQGHDYINYRFDGCFTSVWTE